MPRVQPGVELVRARLRRFIRLLSRLLLPTFERPAKAISTLTGGGSCTNVAACAVKRASRTVAVGSVTTGRYYHARARSDGGGGRSASVARGYRTASRPGETSKRRVLRR